MYSIFYDGEVLDYRFEYSNGRYVFYTGDILQGQIWKMGPRRWDLVCNCEGHVQQRSVKGFGSRIAAADHAVETFMIVNNGYGYEYQTAT